MVNVAAYLPSLGSGVPFLLLYPGAVAVGRKNKDRSVPAAALPHDPPSAYQPENQTVNQGNDQHLPV